MKYVLMYWINYVDKKRGWGSVESPQRVTCPLEGGGELCVEIDFTYSLHNNFFPRQCGFKTTQT